MASCRCLLGVEEGAFSICPEWVYGPIEFADLPRELDDPLPQGSTLVRPIAESRGDEGAFPFAHNMRIYDPILQRAGLCIV